MKDIIQKDILEAAAPSDVNYVTHIFKQFDKFLVSPCLQEDDAEDHTVITLIFTNGENDHWKFDEEKGHYMLTQDAGHTRDFRLCNISAPKGTVVPRYHWLETKDFVMPALEKGMPTIADLLALPTLDTDADMYDFMENGLDEFLRCEAYDLGREAMGKYVDMMKFEVVLKNTTDYGKYGMVVYRMLIDGTPVGIATRSGRYLDNTMLYPTDFEYLKSFMEEIEENCLVDEHGLSTVQYESTGSVGFLDDDILDALYEGTQINEGN